MDTVVRGIRISNPDRVVYPDLGLTKMAGNYGPQSKMRTAMARKRKQQDPVKLRKDIPGQ